MVSWMKRISRALMGSQDSQTYSWLCHKPTVTMDNSQIQVSGWAQSVQEALSSEICLKMLSSFVLREKQKRLLENEEIIPFCDTTVMQDLLGN